MALVTLKEVIDPVRVRAYLSVAREGVREHWRVLAGVGGTAVAGYLLQRWWRARGGPGPPPPGPRGWPIIGNMYDMTDDLHMDGIRLRKEYGDVIALNVFGSCTVILNGPAAIREALVKNSEDFSTTIQFTGMLQGLIEFNDDIFGTPYNSGAWLDHKKFAVRTLRNFGFGTSLGENKILDEIDKMMSSITASSSEPFDPRDIAQQTAAAVVYSILLGRAWERDDPEFLDLLYKEKKWAETMFDEELIEMEQKPKIIQRLFYREAGERYARIATDYLQGLERIIAEHIPDCDVDNPRDVIDAYIRERGSGLQTRRLACNIVMFSTDAIDTFSSALAVTLFYLAKYPDVQSRVRAQIDAEVGSSRKVMVKDKPSLPLVEAVVYETLRIYSLAPLLIPRVSQNDVSVMGYVIPKGAMVFPNVWSVHMDPERYPEPNHFRLEHFLDEKGSLKPLDYFLPFGAGRRSCMGEQLAKMELFLMVGNLVQNFRISFPVGFVPYEDDGYVFNGSLRALPEFKLIFSPRQ